MFIFPHVCSLHHVFSQVFLCYICGCFTTSKQDETVGDSVEKKRCAYFSIKMATKTSHGHFQFARLCRKPSVDYRKTKSFGFWWHGWSHRITVILWLNQYFWIQFKNQIICQLNSILLMQNEITLVVASRHFIS